MMIFTNWWAWLFLLVIPLIILLYLLKQKAKEHPVSSLYLWREAYKNIIATTWWEKLRNNLLMYLQILIMAIVIIALAAPFLLSDKKGAGNVILVIDNSASMNAYYDDNNTRLEQAKKEAMEYLKDYDNGASVSVISCHNTPQSLVSNSTNQNEIKEVIAGIAPTDIEGNLSLATSFLDGYVAGLKEYQIVLFTDSSCDMKKLNASIVSLHSEKSNLSVDYVSHSIKEGKLVVIAKISNTGINEETGDVNLYIDEEMVDIKETSLKEGESTIIYFEEWEGLTKKEDDSTVITVQINEKDGLLEDNTGYDVVTKEGNHKILLISEQNVFLEKAILSSTEVELYKTVDVDEIDHTMEFDLYIFDGMLPKVWPESGNVLLINPKESVNLNMLKGSQYQEVEATEYDSKTQLFYVEDSKTSRVKAVKHSITVGLEEFEFVAGEVKQIPKPIWAESFMSNDTYSAGFIGNIEGRGVAVLSFDLHQTDLPLQVEFPILINGLLKQCMNLNQIQKNKLYPGDKLLVSVIENDSSITVTKGSVTDTYGSDAGIFGYTDTMRSGVYQVQIKSQKENKKEAAVVNFPSASESSMTKKEIVLTVEGNQVLAQTSTGSGNTLDLRYIFILLAILILLIEWVVYIRA